jgi:hypothetical protein
MPAAATIMTMMSPKFDIVKESLFKHFINFNSESCVLVYADQKCTLAAPLARHAKLAIIYCDNYEDARIVRDCLPHKGSGNVRIVVGALDAWPFRRRLFDIVALGRLNYSLPSDASSLSRVLPEIQKSLVVTGQVYFCSMLSESGPFIENYLRRRTLSRALKNTGLVRTAAIEHYPDLYDAQYLKLIKSRRHGLSLSQIKDGIKVFLNKGYFGEIYTHYGNKGKLDCSLLEGIRAQLQSETGLRLRDANLIWVGSAEGVVVDYGAAIVRLPQSEMNVQRCERNHETLEKLGSMKLPVVVPVALNKGRYNGQPYFTESKISGMSIDLNQPNKKEMMRIYGGAVDLMLSKEFAVSRLNEPIFDKLIENEISGLAPFVTEDDQKIILSSMDSVKGILLKHKIPAAVHHGDFKCSNFICDKKFRISGLIDWDLSSIPGFPLLDWFTLYHSYLHYARNNGSNQNYMSLLRNIIEKPMDNEAIPAVFKRANISCDCIPIFTFLAQLYYVNNHYYAQHKQSKNWYEDIMQGQFMPSCGLISNLCKAIS